MEDKKLEGIIEGLIRAGKKDEEIVDIVKMVEKFKPEAVEYNGDTKTGYSVLVQDKNSDFEAWVDVWVNTSTNDIEKEWNQYIFHTNNSKDIFQKEMQDNDTIYDMATSEAVNFLEEKGILKNEDAGWSYGDKVKGSTRKEKENMLWKNKHRDYKTIMQNGKKAVMRLNEEGVTELCPLDALTDEQLDKELEKNQ